MYAKLATFGALQIQTPIAVLFQTLPLSVSQFPGKLGWPSRCEHTVTLSQIL